MKRDWRDALWLKLQGILEGMGAGCPGEVGEVASGQCGRKMRRIADLDLLRNINNTYGHLAGDAVLETVGAIIRGAVREYDIAARFGGEEFIAIVPGGLESVSKIAERVRSGFEVAGATIGTHTVGATVSIAPLYPTTPSRQLTRWLHVRTPLSIVPSTTDEIGYRSPKKKWRVSELDSSPPRAARAQWGRARLPVCSNTRRPSDTLIQAKQSNHGRCNLSFTLSAV